MANSVTTVKAREKFAKAHAGDAALPKIVQVGWGNGGHDGNRQPIMPANTLTQVPGEFLKKAIDGHSFPITTTLRIAASLQAGEGNGIDVSACGLYDEAGDLIAVKTFTPKNKDAETVIEIDWDEEF